MRSPALFPLHAHFQYPPDLTVDVGDEVTWRITSNQGDAVECKIQFDDSQATFFDSSNQTTGGLGAAITGTAPSFGKTSGGQTVCKYTVSLLDASGRTVATLDPNIVVREP